jgi:hypothetical protein
LQSSCRRLAISRRLRVPTLTAWSNSFGLRFQVRAGCSPAFANGGPGNNQRGSSFVWSPNAGEHFQHVRGWVVAPGTNFKGKRLRKLDPKRIGGNLPSHDPRFRFGLVVIQLLPPRYLASAPCANPDSFGLTEANGGPGNNCKRKRRSGKQFYRKRALREAILKETGSPGSNFKGNGLSKKQFERKRALQEAILKGNGLSGKQF